MNKKSKNIIKSLLVSTLITGTFVSLSLNHVVENKEEVVAHAAPSDSYYAGCTSTDAKTLLSQIRSVVSKRTSNSYDGLFSIYPDSDMKDGRLVDIYSPYTNYTATTKKCGSYKVEGDCWNREHCIPKSWWGGSTSNQGADPFIVFPSDGKVNGMRSAYPFGIVGTVKSSSTKDYCLLGNAKSGYDSGVSGYVFEPADEWKGDMARVYFYAIAAYSGASGWTSGNGNYVFSSSGINGLTTYARNLFVKWHLEDPVDDWEMHRCDAVYAHSKNRNPFIDHPEWVQTIWGDSPWYDGSSSQTAPTSLTMNQNAVEVGVNGHFQLTVTANKGASNSVSWSSSNPSNVSVTSSGLVTGLTENTSSVITATSTLDSNVKATCTVTVTDGTVEITGIDADPVSVRVNKTATISYTLSPENASPVNVTYTSTNTSIATVNASGVVTGKAAGSTTITVYGQNTKTGTTKYVVINVEVSDTQAGTGNYLLVEDNDDLEVGADYVIGRASEGKVAGDLSGQYLASVSQTYSTDSNSKKYIEENDLSADAEVFTLGKNGNNYTFTGNSGTLKDELLSVTAVKKLAAGNGVTTWTVSVNNTGASISSTTSDYGIMRYNSGSPRFTTYASGQSSIELYKKDGDAVVIHPMGIKLDKTLVDAVTGEEVTLTATVLPADATETNVTWSTSDATIATVSEGVVTTKKAGTVTITATSEPGSDGTTTYSASCTITISDPIMVEEIDLGMDTMTLEIGDVTEIEPIVYPDEAALKELNWSSSSTSVATVSNGTVTALAAGTTTITATAKDGSGVHASLTLTVVPTKNSIKPLYSLASGTSLAGKSEYGLYMGYYAECNKSGQIIGYNIFIGNGDYSIMIYSYADKPTWTPFVTYLQITGGSISVYENLYEINNSPTLTDVTNTLNIEEYVEPIEMYTVTGTEVGSEKLTQENASRPVVVSGTVTNVSGSFTTDADTTVTMELENGNSISVFVKRKLNNLSELQTAIGTVGNTATLRCFTSIYKTNFQMVAPTVVEADPDYTAVMFATEFLSDTDTICAKGYNNGSELSNLWGNYELNKYSNLSDSEKTILRNADKTESSTLGRAMARYDFICIKYGLKNFIGRSSANRSLSGLFFGNENNLYWLLLAGGIVFVVASGGLYLSFRKKEK